MKRVLVVKHAAHEGLGRLAAILAAHDYQVQQLEPYRGEVVPKTLADHDLLVMMGGPLGVYDKDRPEFSFLVHEIRLLENCLAQNRPILGICLGAQLLAAAAGARVVPMHKNEQPLREVGWGNVSFHPSHDTDPLFRGIPSSMPVLHWHGDIFDIPANARRIASNEVCPNQGFQIGSRQVGLQFHPEVSPNDVEAFSQADTEYAIGALGPDAVQQLRADTERFYPAFAPLGARLLDNIVGSLA
jgi:GMP synthase (glutamine-hydrolysing)